MPLSANLANRDACSGFIAARFFFWAASLGRADAAQETAADSRTSLRDGFCGLDISETLHSDLFHGNREHFGQQRFDGLSIDEARQQLADFLGGNGQAATNGA